MPAELLSASLKVHMMWGLLLLLFVLAAVFRRTPVLLWLFRLSALAMVASGLVLLIAVHFMPFFVLKAVLGVLLIGLAEMLLARLRRGERPPAVLWVLFVALFIIVPFLGYNGASL
ncbi:MAG: DUF1516 family protein [Hydrogenibacillus sp.]|nr:DUF1516 family protein [Hydrogenibacillus sp.]